MSHLKIKKQKGKVALKSTKYPWLTLRELSVLASGGWFDTENNLHNNEGAIQCTHYTPRTVNGKCKNFAVPGEVKCKMHGGLALRNKHQREHIYSKYIIDPDIAALFESEAKNTGQIKGITEELGLLRALLAGVIKESNFDADSLKDVAATVKEIRCLVTDYMKIEMNMGQLIEISKVALIVKELGNIVKKYITNDEVLEKIAQDFANIPIIRPINNLPKPSCEQPIRQIPALPETV